MTQDFELPEDTGTYVRPCQPPALGERHSESLMSFSLPRAAAGMSEHRRRTAPIFGSAICIRGSHTGLSPRFSIGTHERFEWLILPFPSLQRSAALQPRSSATLKQVAPMVFVLDNYDSFTYNLVQYMGELGAEMTISRNDQLTVEQIEDLKPERIVLSPGPCTPRKPASAFLSSVISPAKCPSGCLPGPSGDRSGLRRQCRSCTEVDARQNQPGRARWTQSVRRPAQPHDLHPLPLAHRCRRGFARGTGSQRPRTKRNGDGTIMGLRHRRFPIEGVQFHPESVLTVDGKNLIRNFLSL